MQEIKTEIMIKTSIDKVWQVLLNFTDYPHWNPFIRKIVGNAVIGETLEVCIQQANGKKHMFKPRIINCVDNRELRWVGVLGASWLFRGEHYFCLEAVDANTTRLVQGEQFSGTIAGLLMAVIKKPTEQGFNAMNKALAARCYRL